MLNHRPSFKGPFAQIHRQWYISSSWSHSTYCTDLHIAEGVLTAGPAALKNPADEAS